MEWHETEGFPDATPLNQLIYDKVVVIFSFVISNDIKYSNTILPILPDNPVGRKLKARSVSFIQFLVTSRVLNITNSYVHQPSLQALKDSKLHIRL